MPYKYLTDINLLNNLLSDFKGDLKLDANKYKMVSALKNIIILE